MRRCIVTLAPVRGAGRKSGALHPQVVQKCLD